VRQIFKPMPLIAALLLTACAVPPRHDAQPRETWGFAAANDEWPAKLIYGLEETDIVSLGFTCRAASGAAQIVVFVSEAETTWPEKLELRSGKVRQIFDLTPSSQSDLPTLNAEIDPSGPIAVSFARSGRLEAAMGGVGRALDADDGRARREVSDFWRTCARNRSSKHASQ